MPYCCLGSDDGQIGILWTRSLLDIHESVAPLTVISAHQQPITDIVIASDLAFSSSLDFTVKVSTHFRFITTRRAVTNVEILGLGFGRVETVNVEKTQDCEK